MFYKYAKGPGIGFVSMPRGLALLLLECQGVWHCFWGYAKESGIEVFLGVKVKVVRMSAGTCMFQCSYSGTRGFWGECFSAGTQALECLGVLHLPCFKLGC